MEDGPPIFGQDSTCPALLVPRLVPPLPFRIRGYHPLWPDFPDRSARDAAKTRWLFRFRSPLLSESRFLSPPGGTEMVHFPPLPSTAYEFSGGSSGISQRGFPHSEIPGSKLVCSSPGLIAAYRVLHRLLAPRHSPYALSSLTTSV